MRNITPVPEPTTPPYKNMLENSLNPKKAMLKRNNEAAVLR